MPDPIKFNPRLIKSIPKIKLHTLVKPPVIVKPTDLKIKPQVFKTQHFLHQLPKLQLLNLLPVPLEKLKVPYLKAGTPHANSLFQVNQQAHQFEYLPAYEIGTEPVDGKSQYKISLKEHPNGEGGTLKIVLHSIIPKELKGQVDHAQPMKHKTDIFLSFNASGALKKIPFNQVKKVAIGYEATAAVHTLNEFNQLYAALSEGVYQAELQVQRHVSIGIAQEKKQEVVEKQPALKPQLRFIKRATVQNAKGKFVRFHLGINNWAAYPETMFKAKGFKIAGRILPKVRLVITDGKNILKKQSITSKRQLRNLHFAVSAQRQIKNCQVEIRDLQSKKLFKSEVIPLRKTIGKPRQSTQTLYVVQRKTWTQKLNFHFPDNLHTYIYGKTRNLDLLPNGYQPIRFVWPEDGKTYLYLQEQVNPKSFFYLPDYFSLSRKQVPGFPPNFSTKLVGDSKEALKAHISFEAMAEWNTKRLMDALPKLSQETGIAEEDILLIPLSVHSEQLKLKLSFPGANGFQERKQAATYLDKITDTLPPLSLDQFQSLLENLSSGSAGSSLLHGHLEVHIPQLTIDPVPLALRFTHVEEEMIAITAAERHVFKITFTNPTSSTLSADAARISLSGQTASFKDLNFPFAIAPGQSRTVEIQCEDHTVNASPTLELEWLGMRAQQPDMLFKDTTATFTHENLVTEQYKAIQLTNLIESSISFAALSASSTIDGSPIDIHTQDLDFPVQIGSEESLYLKFPDAIENAEDLSLDFKHLKALPDKFKIYDHIVDSSISSVFETQIPVRSFISLGTDTAIKFLEIEFKASENAPLLGSVVFTKADSFDAGFAQKSMKILLPIKDFILNMSSSGNYLYRIRTVVQKSNQPNQTQSLIGTWSHHAGSLEITSDLLPSPN